MRVNPKTGKLSGYYRLIESYRNINDRICHRQMLAAGFLDDLTAEQLNLIQKGLNLRVEGLDNTLFAEETDPVIASYIEHFYQQLSKEKRIDVPSKTNKARNWQTIDINTLRNKDVREMGAEWLCYQGLKQLKMDSFLESKGWAPDKTALALTHLISRAVYPASEYQTSRWIRENSAVCEITGYDAMSFS